MFGRKGVKRVQPMEPSETQDGSELVEGFSLEQLGSAYAQAIQLEKPSLVAATSESIPTDTPDGLELQEDLDLTVDSEVLLSAPAVEESDGVAVTPESILESMLFLGSSSNKPLPISRLCELFRGFSPEDLQGAVDHLNAIYLRDDHAFEIVREPGGYLLQLRPELGILRDRFYGKIKETHLTQSAIDCLALVAYQPGINKQDLEKQWNQPASSMLSTLVRKGLLRIERSAQAKENHSQYYTTDRLLKVIGLASLEDLPSSEDI